MTGYMLNRYLGKTNCLTYVPENIKLEHTYGAWTMPTLSANGTVGGDSYAVRSSSEYGSSYATYNAFNGSSTTFWSENGVSSSGYIEFYSPFRLKVSKITIQNRSEYVNTWASGIVYGSLDGTNYFEMATFTNSNATASANWQINITNSQPAKYIRISTKSLLNSTHSLSVAQMTITATAQNTIILKAGSKVYVPNGFETTTQYGWFLDGGTIEYQYMTSTSENPAVGDTVEYGKDGEIYTITDITVDSNGNVTAIQVNGIWYNRDSSYDEVVNDTTKPIFDEVVIASDKTFNNTGGTGKYLMYYRATNGVFSSAYSNSQSGTTIPTATTSYQLFYNTSENKVYFDGGSWLDGYSLPLTMVSSVNGFPTSIDQIFDWCGYIGSTVFVLPGVKGLIPNGFNEDGTYKSVEFTINKPVIYTDPWKAVGSLYYGYWYGLEEVSNYFKNEFVYDEKNNLISYRGKIQNICVIAEGVTDSNGKITSLTPASVKTTDDYKRHLLNYNGTYYILRS